MILNPINPKYLNAKVPEEKEKAVVHSARLVDFKNQPMLLDAFLYLTGNDGKAAGICREKTAECAWFPKSNTLIVMNNEDREAIVHVSCPAGDFTVPLKPLETKIETLE